MATDDKICMVCGKHHKYCANDVRYNKDETWRNLYCSEECRKIFGVYKDIKDGKLGGENASKKALGLGLAEIMNIKEPMRSVLVSYAKKFKSAEKTESRAKSNIQDKPEQKQKTNGAKTNSNNRRRNSKQKNN